LNTVIIGFTFFGVEKFLQIKYSAQLTVICTFIYWCLCSKFCCSLPYRFLLHVTWQLSVFCIYVAAKNRRDISEVVRLYWMCLEPCLATRNHKYV